MKGIKIEIEEQDKPMYLYRSFDVVSAIAYALYYTTNPNSDMCIPNCAYKKAEKMFEEWSNETREKKASFPVDDPPKIAGRYTYAGMVFVPEVSAGVGAIKHSVAKTEPKKMVTK